MAVRLAPYARLLTFALLVSAFLLFPAPLPAEPENAAGWTEDDYAAVTVDDFRKEARFLERLDFTDIDYPRLHAAIFYATNEIRLKRGLTYLEYAPELERSAFGHARRMAEKNFFSHTDSTDRRYATPNDRGRLAGIANPFLAENIADTFAIAYAAGKNVYPRSGAKGSFSYAPDGPLLPPHTYLSFADDVLKIWMNSSGHRANILSTNALQLGCGTYLYYKSSFYGMPMFKAVQNFQWYHKIEPGEAED
jgi:uncharacterized protein YkwD